MCDMRKAFEAWAEREYGTQAYLHTSATCGEWQAWQAAWTARKPQWLPIDSAPTDGTEFLAFSPNTGAVILTYLDSDHPDYDGDTPHVTWDHTSFWSATHWMPLPAAPDIGEGEGK